MNGPSFVAMFGLPGGSEWIVIGIAALLIFGRRLPDVARSLGRSIVEFKRGVRDVREDVDEQSRIAPPSDSPSQHQIPASTAPTSTPPTPSTTETVHTQPLDDDNAG